MYLFIRVLILLIAQMRKTSRQNDIFLPKVVKSWRGELDKRRVGGIK
jgi:hypothetical protein